MRRLTLLAGLGLAVIAATALVHARPHTADAQSGQDRLVVFETFQRSN